jgi:hypothetical protein
LAIPVFLILGVAWAVFLVWPRLHERMSGPRTSSVTSFTHRFSAIRKTGADPWRTPNLAPPPSAQQGVAKPGLGTSLTQHRMSTPATRSRRRRRDVLCLLGAAVAGSLLLAGALGGPILWAVQVLADLLLVAYLLLLVRIRSTAAARANVHYLPQRIAQPAQGFALRRTASS